MTDNTSTDSTAENKGGNDGDTPIHSQAKLESILAERLARQKQEFEKRLSEHEELKAKAQKFDELEESTRTETERATARAEAAERKLADRDAADQKRAEEQAAAEQRAQLVKEIAEEKGVDASVLRGSTREDIEEHASQLLAFIPAPKNASDSESGGSRGGDIEGGELSADDIVAQATAR